MDLEVWVQGAGHRFLWGGLEGGSGHGPKMELCNTELGQGSTAFLENFP